MKSKVKIMLALMMFIGLTGVMAQDRGPKGDRGAKVEALRKAHIIEQLNLSEQEQQDFFPILDAHHESKKGIRKAMRTIKKEGKDPATLSEAQFLSNLDKLSDLRIEEVALDKKFAKDTVSILGVERTLKLKDIEKEFRRKMKEKRGDRRGGGHEGPGDRDGQQY